MGVIMKKESKELDILLTFLKDTKEGKYIEIDKESTNLKEEYTDTDFNYDEENYFFSLTE